MAKLHRTVIAAGWVSLFTDFSSDMIMPLLPLFLKTVLGAGTAFIGLIEGAAETTASLLKLATGYYSDRWRQRKIFMFAGYTVSALTRPLIALALAPWHVLAVRLADRAGKGIRTSPRDALIAGCTAPADRGRAFGFQRAMDHAGAFIGPLVAAGLLWVFKEQLAFEADKALRWVFLLAAVPGLLVPFIIWKFITEEGDVSLAGKPGAINRASLRKLDSRFRLYLGAVTVFTLGNSSDAFLILRAVDVGLPQWQVPLIWAAFHGVKTLLSTHGGGLSDRYGRKTLIGIGWAIYALSYILFGLASAPWQMWAIFLFYGLFASVTEGSERAYVAELVPVELRGTAYGFYNAAVGIAALPASWLFGALWQWSGRPLVPFGVGAGFAILAFLLLLRVKPPKPAAA
jgi:MFS family permease